MQRVESMSEGEVKLGPGTLYGALSKLEKQGLIRKEGESGDNRRKQYILTNEGWQVIELEFKRLSKLVTISQSIFQKEEIQVMSKKRKRKFRFFLLGKTGRKRTG